MTEFIERHFAALLGALIVVVFLVAGAIAGGR
jgi:hypothetical protein